MVEPGDEGGEAPCFAHLVDEPAAMPLAADGVGQDAPVMVGTEVWFNPSCSKCRTAQGILVEHGVAATYVDYLGSPPSVADLRRVLGLLGVEGPRAIARRGEAVWAELDLDGATDDEVLAALAAHPILIERPIVIVGDRAIVARPAELVLELLEPAPDGPSST